MRKFLFRVAMVIVLVASPILFPAALLWIDHRVRLADLSELYREAWSCLRRGYL